MFIATMCGIAINCIYLFFKLKAWKYYKPKLVDLSLIKEVCGYSLPLVPNQISGWILSASDRTIIAKFLSVAENGVYSVANKFSNLVGTFYGFFNLAWVETVSVHYNDSDRDEFIGDMMETVSRVYNSYLHYLERKMKSKIKEFIFRDKIGGWHKHVEKIIYENGKIEYRDGYTQLFYTNLPLRRSCGECPFSTIKRCGDFTVGDFWGVQDVLPEFDDNKGVSLLFFNNDRALERFDSFKEMLKYQEISVTDAVRQPNLKGHSVIPKNVNAFWRDFQKKGIGYCISFYSPAGIPFRIKRKIKYIYSKVTRK